MRATIRATLLMGCAVALGACTTTTQPRWGERVTFTPGFSVLKTAAVRAATDPLTWAPVAAAGVLAATGADEEWSEEIVDHAPLFGADSEDASVHLRNLTYAAYVITALATPGDGTPSGWFGAKLRGLETGVAALSLEGIASEGLKSLTGRERPDGENDRSFPSGHAGQSSAAASLAVANLDYLDLPGWMHDAAAVTFYGMAAGSGWARVESERHYLTDSLFGFALGHFLARFVEEAFLESGGREVSVASVPVTDGLAFRVAVPLGERRVD
jgi:hypothetical protein